MSEAFVYYLPAFLIASLDPDESDMTFSATLWALSPPPFGTGTLETFNERVHSLDEEQIKVISAFFDYVSLALPEYIPLHESDSGNSYGTLTKFWSEHIRHLDRKNKRV